MNLWQSVSGMARVEMVSAEALESIERILQAGIPIDRVEYTDCFTVQFSVLRRNLPLLQSMCAKRGDRLRVLESLGLYWQLKSLLHRKFLVSGLILLIFLTLFLPTRVLFVRVSGNRTVPAAQILNAAEVCGLSFGVSRRGVRSETIKNGLLSKVPELQWAGVNTIGCTAVISVREKPSATEQNHSASPCSIVAARDGIVTDVSALRGTALCTPGQAVQKGQTLISGYTDCGLFLRSERAEGEIYAQTQHTQRVIMPTEYTIRAGRQRTVRIFSLILGKKRIKFMKGSRIWENTCGRIYEENYLTLPGGFRLPIALAKEEITYWELESGSEDAAQAQSLMAAQGEAFLKDRMIAGTILNRREIFSEQGGAFQMTVQYDCREMIGREHPEEIGEYHGKTG